MPHQLIIWRRGRKALEGFEVIASSGETKWAFRLQMLRRKALEGFEVIASPVIGAAGSLFLSRKALKGFEVIARARK